MLNQEIKVRCLYSYSSSFVLWRLFRFVKCNYLMVARRKMVHQQHLLKEAELHRLDDEIRKKVCSY